jgi:hypothetical protein
MVLLVYLHSMAQSVMELLALIGPAAIIFGAGAVLVIIPIVHSGGERYQHEEYHAQEASSNGDGHEPGSKAGTSVQKVPTTPVRRKR